MLSQWSDSEGPGFGLSEGPGTEPTYQGRFGRPDALSPGHLEEMPPLFSHTW